MVGVPRSLGCTICRKQKKKCIVDGQLPCARCKRLKLKCTGAGQQRFKFHEDPLTLRAKEHHCDASLSPDSRSEPVSPGPPISPSSPDALAQALVHCIDRQNTDPRFHLVWAFGDFLELVPQHIGTCPALDAAVDVLVRCYSCFRARRVVEMDAHSLTKYNTAISTLRTALAATEEAADPRTLCAIMILIIVESLAHNMVAMQHSGGAASVIKSRGMKPPASPFEQKILKALRGPVIWQSLFLELSFFSDLEWKALLDVYSDEAIDTEGGLIDEMGSLVRLFQRTRATRSSLFPDTVEMDQLTQEIHALKSNLGGEPSQLDATLAAMREQQPPDASLGDTINWLISPRDYGLLIPMRIMLNCMLDSLQGVFATAHRMENEAMCHAACDIAEQAVRFRPLGSLWVGLMLLTAYPGAREETEQKRLRYWITSYTEDLHHGSASSQNIDLDSFARYVRCEDLTGEECNWS